MKKDEIKSETARHAALAVGKKQGAVVKETASAVKTASRKPSKRAERPEKPAEVKPEITIQYQNRDASLEKIENAVKEAFAAKGGKPSEMKTVKIYIKPEENAAYYVIDDSVTGSIRLY